MRRSTIDLMPSPWMPSTQEVCALGSGLLQISAGTLAAAGNDAQFIPVVFPQSATINALSFVAANGTGNYDVGLYDPDLRLLVSSGSTALSAAGVKTLSIPDLRVTGGERYMAALALSSTSGQVLRWNATSSVWQRAAGWFMQASALPLPSTATPSFATAYTVIPAFAFGVR